MKHHIAALLLLIAPFASAQQPVAARQNLPALRAVVEQYLQTQTAGLPGQVSVKVGNVDPRTSLAACPAPEAFQQPGARAWGKTTVGVRCTAPAAWTVYIQASVNVVADYVAAAVPLAQGQAIDASQLVMMKGDIAAMPNGIITDMAQAIGRTPTASLQAGTPLRLDTLKSKPVVQQGQAVRLVSKGANFSVSAEARALGNAGEGQVAQARTQSGTVVSGTARSGGVIEIAI
ncbi:flagellar basal body P-ring formation chaperone FlgA [Telluria aromaticivorans]|uniref:Flagella basal body P-ring formation protein FlgA n=1 Tax=Telluria aromaticivorans TaxID=2725995 RepID=A0A7Y2NZ13_9BURK|nr:flagellar basal body P-ring formation chaperone FlgA [Telluria aromaticivorans]NNG22648.1 flagellar basal body P-ring formation protein FlgA [Telluria aromaticivorans]